MTYGEEAVGLSFNPSQRPDVDQMKRLFAAAIDLLVETRDAGMAQGVSDDEHLRLYLVAITEAQSACMWAVKAMTWSNA